MSEELLDVSSILPFGDALRPLITSSLLTKSEIKKILAKRGIFVLGNEKEKTIPLLSTILLSPTEFEDLVTKQKTKEDTPKIRSQYISSTPDFKIVQSLDRLEGIDELINRDESNYETLTVPTVQAINEEEVLVSYKLVRTDKSKDWANNSSVHEGKVIFKKKKGESRIDIVMESSAVETKEFNEKIIKHAIRAWKEDGHINKEADLELILFEHFDNQERIQFLLSFHDDLDKKGSLNFNQITHVEVGTIPDTPLPKGIQWMQDKVKNIILKGQSLHDIELLTKKEYYDSIVIEIIEADYKFKFRDLEGTCKVEYGFPNYSRRKENSSEFELSIPSIKLTKKLRGTDKKAIESFLLETFNKIVELRYEKYSNKRAQSGKENSSERRKIRVKSSLKKK